ncbi:hypothetical protein CIPAW_08G124400 [Carya illinoinensis]|uniref:Uncharacterized protein n=1 Tax=Carya illinoinensis TaxID=32201 RepID=A0A8T1PLZ9_CARIL|nr:hypothetical protein CIPAW_08G124400 [Carya illinoinensis]
MYQKKAKKNEVCRCKMEYCSQTSENMMEDDKIPFSGGFLSEIKKTLMGCLNHMNKKMELGFCIWELFSCFHQQVKLPYDLCFRAYIFRLLKKAQIMLAASTASGARFDSS